MTAPDLRPPLVLLHGALGAAAQFVALRPLLDVHFRVFTLDFEGHGPQPAPVRGYRMAHFAENLAALIVAEDLAPVRVFGYSMGGYAALALAAQQPGLMHSVMTLGTKFVWDEPTAAREASRLEPETLSAKVPAFAEALAARHATGAGWEVVVRGTADVLRNLGAAPLLAPDVLVSIGLPVRVLVGDRDATVTIEETAAAYRALPVGQLGVLPGVPHPLERVPLPVLAAHIIGFFGGKR
jgi:pimeloyl-ACP methyl ester carboxylesterase